MIRTIYQFGRHLSEIDDLRQYFGVTDLPYPEKSSDGKKVIVAKISNRNNVELHLDTYSVSLTPKYLYRNLASARSSNLVPSMKFYYIGSSQASELKDNFDKFYDRLKRSLDSNIHLYENLFDTKAFLNYIQEYFTAFVSHWLSNKDNYLFTLQIDDKWLGEFPELVELLESSAYDKYRSTSSEVIMGANKVCAVTYQKDTEVWGRVDTLGFTVNDAAFTRGGFDIRESYKMFPVSPEAVRVLEKTMRVIRAKMSFRLGSVSFFVLPHVLGVSEEGKHNMSEITRRFVSKICETTSPDYEARIKSIVNSEKVFGKIISDPDLGVNSVYYDIFFYEENQAQLAIKLHVTDVIPGRFRDIIKIQGKLDALYTPLFQSKKKDDGFPLVLYSLREFFPVTAHFFYKIIEAVFQKNRLNEEQILRIFMAQIIPSFKNISTEPFKFYGQVKRSFCFYQFFQQLQLFGDMKPMGNSELSLNAFDFIGQHSNFFSSNLLKAAFLLGCASEVLMNSQYSNLKSTPFSKRLNNLIIDYRELQRIKVELQAKAGQYADADKLFYRQYLHDLLMQFDHLMMTGDDASVSKTQISYAFSVGLVLEKEFASNRRTEKKKSGADENQN